MIATSLPSVSLSLAGRAGHKFTPPTMLQGFACHARGVEIQIASNTRVVARVRSKHTYDVDLRAENGRLIVGCKCPARSYGLDVCKHAWAALLEIDRKGGLESLRHGTGTLIVEPAPLEDQASEGRAPNVVLLSDKARKRRTSQKSSAKGGDVAAPVVPLSPSPAASTAEPAEPAEHTAALAERKNEPAKEKPVKAKNAKEPKPKLKPAPAKSLKAKPESKPNATPATKAKSTPLPNAKPKLKPRSQSKPKSKSKSKVNVQTTAKKRAATATKKRAALKKKKKA